MTNGGPIQGVIAITEPTLELVQLGSRLRAARLARDESMQLFAQRIGISVPTLRAMESGAASVQVGYWLRALWALDRLHDLAGVLAPSESVLDRARAMAAQPKARRRARRRPP